MTLSQQISERSREIRTDGYSMSIGELISLYKDGDLDVHPEFQRIFRWTTKQKSLLIESILLGIPIPPVFVSARDDGIWDVVDGVQRLSTIFEFVGVYTDEEGHRSPPEPLESGDYLSELDSKMWQSDDPDDSFTDVERRDFKRKSLDIRIVQKGSDKDTKFDLFQRLNSGSVLSPQEIRDCLLVMLNPQMFDTLKSLCQSDAFLTCTPLSERKESTSYRSELVLRFFCQLDQGEGDRQISTDYGEHITNWMRATAKAPVLSDSADSLQQLAPEFNSTFALLEAALGEDVFRRFTGERHSGPFSIAGFETITAGVAGNLPLWTKRGPDVLADKIRSMWTEDFFVNNSGSGISSRTRMPKLVVAGRNYFSK